MIVYVKYVADFGVSNVVSLDLYAVMRIFSCGNWNLIRHIEFALKHLLRAND